jgi:hypothetical protein
LPQAQPFQPDPWRCKGRYTFFSKLWEKEVNMYSTHPMEKQEVMAYLDGELPVERAAAVAAHLQQCAECRSVAEDLRSVARQMLAWQVEPSPDCLTEGVTAALEITAQAEPQARQKKSLWGSMMSQRPTARPLIWAVAGAALVALFLLSIPSLMVERHQSPLQFGPAPQTAQQVERDQAHLRLDGQLAGDSLRPTAQMALAPPGAPAAPSPQAGPMIVRSAELALVTKEFDKAREAIERTLRQHHGFAGQLNVNAPAGAGRTLSATLRVPADEFDAALTELKKLGRVERESQSGEDVTKQYVDLGARLSNARNTEQRLIDVLRQRTGKVADILAVEQEIARVRGDIESMEAEKKSLENRVGFATLQLRLSEEYKAQLEVTPSSTGTQLHNAAVEGYRSAVQAFLSLVLALLSTGPTLVLWLRWFSPCSGWRGRCGAGSGQTNAQARPSLTGTRRSEEIRV